MSDRFVPKLKFIDFSSDINKLFFEFLIAHMFIIALLKLNDAKGTHVIK